MENIVWRAARFRVHGMTCNMCSVSVESVLELLEGVKKVQANYAEGIAKIKYAPALISPAQMNKALLEIGYSIDLEPLEVLDIAKHSFWDWWSA